MPRLIFVSSAGESTELDVRNGTTAMENAVRANLPGIDADCGGACACATCHVYVDPEWTEAVGEPEAMEEDMLDFAWEMKPNSRLSCQIRMRDELDGLVLHVPERQA